MNRTLVKSLLLVIGWWTLSLFMGCINPCGCSDALPYSDFSQTRASYLHTISTVDPGVIIRLDGEGVTFLAQHSCTDWNMHSLYACSCLESGWNGLKYPIEAAHIYSLDDFNDTLPAGTALNPLFWMGENLALTQENLANINYPFFQFYTTTFPKDSLAPQHIWVDLTKSNGEVIISDTIEVLWPR